MLGLRLTKCISSHLNCTLNIPAKLSTGVWISDSCFVHISCYCFNTFKCPMSIRKRNALSMGFDLFHDILSVCSDHHYYNMFVQSFFESWYFNLPCEYSHFIWPERDEEKNQRKRFFFGVNVTWSRTKSWDFLLTFFT